ncbi:MAG: M20/M25/M40 family metallo-hydrolase [Polyangiaceae bacterium]|nr:M20/M25/M40 family metallo-hydrolase [Polyangiaceae bacterium]
MNRAPRALCVGIAALLVALVVLRIRLTDPPAIPVDHASSEEFSATRALEHVEALAARPRPVGTPFHAAAREYIIAEAKRMGLPVEIQHATRINTRWGVPYDVGRVVNVIGKIPGQTPGSAVALSAHYDSVPNAPGAADDASGVAVLLETARLLQSGPALRNDVLFLFMDGEEAGVLGSRAFVAEHPLAKTIELVLNFDARGVRGPVGLIETSADAGGLVRHFAANASFPVASSLFPEVSRRLGHETDLRPFLLAGKKGLNFAFADGVAHYHAPTDRVDYLDPRSVRHAGTQAVALARSFGDANLNEFAPERVFYFDLPAIGVLVFPERANWFIAAATLILFGIVFAITMRHKKTRTFGIFAGLIGILASVAATATLAGGASLALRALLPAFGAYRGDPADPTFIRAAFVFLGATFCIGTYASLRRHHSWWDLAVGAILSWVVLALVTTIWLPGASYLFAIPALSQLLLCLYLLRFDPEQNRPQTTALAMIVAALPLILVAVPVPYLLFVALGLPRSAIAAGFVALIASLVAPLWELLGAARSKWPVLATSAAFAAAFMIAVIRAGFSPESPRPVCLAYALDAAAQKAVWLSSDEHADPWVAAHATKEVFLPSFPLPGQGMIAREGPAPIADLAAPILEKVADETQSGVRTLRMRLRSARGAPFVLVTVASQSPILRATIDGQTIDEDKPSSWPGDDPWGFTFQGLPPEGIEWSIDVTGSAKVTVRVVDRTYELPENLLQDKPPADRMPMPFRLSNSTFVATAAQF